MCINVSAKEAITEERLMIDLIAAEYSDEGVDNSELKCSGLVKTWSETVQDYLRKSKFQIGKQFPDTCQIYSDPAPIPELVQVCLSKY